MILSVDEVNRILQQPSGQTPKEVRDKAMLELLYATGIRVSERLIGLEVEDLKSFRGLYHLPGRPEGADDPLLGRRPARR